MISRHQYLLNIVFQVNNIDFESIVYFWQMREREKGTIMSRGCLPETKGA
jgi:hypothetical protein